MEKIMLMNWLKQVALVGGVCFLTAGWGLSAQAQESNNSKEAKTVEATEATEASENEQQQPEMVGWLELEERLREGPVPFTWVSEAEAPPALSDVLEQLETVARKDRYRGVVVSLKSPPLRLTQIHAIRKAIAEVREAGKKVLVFSQSYDLMNYLLASAADQIVLQRGGRIQLSGLAMEEWYLGGLLEKLGAEADLIQIGQYKGAKDPLAGRQPTEPWDENISALLDDLYEQVITPIAESRGVSRTKMEQLMRSSWGKGAQAAQEAGLVDRIGHRDLVSVTEVAFGEDFIWDQTMGQHRSQQQIDSPLAFFQTLFQEPEVETNQPSIALLHAQGPIVTGESARGEGPLGGNRIGSETMIEQLGRVRRDDQIKGAVLRINSPGGSALASEIIWQAVRETANQKPVYVSLGDTAASGGYYIAVGGDRIYVSPQSLVGSIGAVGGKVVLEGLYDSIGLSVTRRSRGPMAGAFTTTEPFTDKQRQAVRRSLQQVYNQFVDRVELGRGSRIDKIGQVAEGRLFTGSQAVDNGLADRLGGVQTTVQDLAAELDLEAGQYQLIHLPPPMSLQQFLNNSFGPEARKAHRGLNGMETTARRLLGRKQWRAVRPTLSGLLELRDEKVLTLMPTVLTTSD